MHYFILIISVLTFIQGKVICQTHLVKEINPNFSYATGNELSSGIEFDGDLYFIVQNYSVIPIPQLWKSDGTEQGTYQATEILSGEGIYRIINFNNKIYFAGTSQDGIELWMTDGTEDGTSLVKDLSPGSGSGDPSNFHVVNNTLYFTANYNGFEFELWKTDGTTIGTTLVTTIPSIYYVNAPEWFNSSNGILCFYNYTNSDAYTLWRSDGTEAGTYEIKDDQGLTLLAGLPIAINNKILFYGQSIGGANQGLWEVNSSSPEATIVFETNSSDYRTYNDNIYFTSINSASAAEIWVTDGTLAQTNILYTLPSQFNAIGLYGIYNDTLLYAAQDLSGQINPTTNSLSLSTQISSEIPNLHISSILATTDSGVLISAFSNLLWHGNEPTILSGTVSSEVVDLYPGTNGSEPTKLLQIGEWVYFSANDGTSEKQLWKMSIETLEYHKLSDIGLTAEGSEIYLMTNFNDLLFFAANDGQNGIEPWVSDGTEQGTQLIKDINVGAQGSTVRDFCVLNNEMYFFTGSPAQLYKTDGTLAGTSLIANIEYAGSKDYTILNNELYFKRGDSYTNEIWKTDGTPGGTMQVIQIGDIINGSYLAKPFKAGNSIFFQANDIVSGLKWYKSDGTQAGTEIANPSDSDPVFSASTNNVHEFNNKLIVTKLYNNDVYIYSLDEVSSSASLIHQFIDYPEVIGYQQAFYSILNGDFLYFVLGKVGVGKELWRIDLTNNNPELLYANINGIEQLIVINDTLYFPSGDKILAITNALNEPFFIANNILEVETPIIFDGQVAYHGSFSYDKHTPAIISNQDVYPILSTNMGMNYISNMIGANQNLYFTNESYNIGPELWVYEKDLDTIPKLILDTAACQMFYWDVTNTSYTYSNYYFETLQDINGSDSLKVILSLKVYNPIPQPITGSPFIIPTDYNSCNGLLLFDVGTADIVATIDNNITTPMSNEVIVGGNLCHGIHAISISDSCGYSYQSVFIIPYPDETINNISGNPVIDSVGYIVENCTITYDDIDTAFITSISVIDSTATVNWTIIDVLGNSYFEIATYNIPEGLGNYLFQISLYCPTKLDESVFAITQDIYNFVSIEDNKVPSFLIYPNPTEANLSVLFDGQKAPFKIINAQGQLVQEGNITSGDNVNLEGLTAGIYFFELSLNENKLMKRFVKR